jgi:hypothetical protein
VEFELERRALLVEIVEGIAATETSSFALRVEWVFAWKSIE